MNKHLLIVKCIVLSILFSLSASAQAPVANFSANNTTGCPPIVTQFTDLSTNNPTSWYWDLGNGSTSTLQNPSTTYINPGTYTVSLTATNSNGSNTKTVVGYITIATSPVVAFTADSTISCSLPRTIVFTNNSVAGGSGSPSYLWDFGDGFTSTSANPSHTYTTYGNFTVTLLVTNGSGCSQSLSKSGYIKNQQKPAGSFTASGASACVAPATVSFTNTTTGGVSYYWDFGDGGNSTSTNPTHTYNTSGNYTVTLISTNSGGCKDTLVSTNFVNIGKPTASFTPSSTTGCTGRSITMTNTSTPSGYTSAWNFGDGGTSTANNPTYSYATAGTYSVRLIVTKNGCSDTAFRTINIGTVPGVSFYASPVSGCTTPFTTSFVNTTTGATSYLWNFGDGGTSTSSAPSHTYNSYGVYTVKLIATGAYGCSDSFTQSNYIVVSPPTANIIVTAFAGCAPINVTLTANVNTVIPVSNYTWNFGDGSSVLSCSSCGSPTHTYTTAGTYTVTLTYTTGTGCTYSVSTPVTVSTKPTASFTASPTTLCPGTPVTFTNSSSNATSYQWSFGDGGASTATSPVYTGYSYGVYTVRLIADNNGCKDTMTRTNYITVNPPNAYFNIATSCTNRFTITITDASAGANTYLWDFGDGSTSTQAGGTLTHTYSSPGTYNVVLQVTNTSNGCTSQHNAYVIIQPLTAAFTCTDTTLCRGTPTQFIAGTSSIITNYHWDLGAGNIYDMPTGVIGDYYTNSGNYTIKLVLTDIYGCKDSIIKVNHVHVGGATVNFTASPTSGCMPLPVTFTDISTPNGGFPVTSRKWYFGTGSPVTTSSNTTSFTYTTVGTYTVKLVATDANGCIDSLTKTNYVSATKPMPQFTSNDTNKCIGQVVSFTNTSTGGSLTYQWSFGDGGTSTATSPSHTYAVAGNYNVKLVVTDGGGCKDSITKIAFIKVGSPTVGFTMSDSIANCPPLLVAMTNTSSGVSSYSWSFGNGSQSTLLNPTTLYTYPGNYTVKLIGTSTAGCRDSATRIVHVYGPTGTLAYAPIAGCTPLTVSFTATSSNTSLFIWDLGNGFTQATSANTYSITYTQTGRYVPKLILSDGASCLVPVQGLDTIKADHMDADFSFTPNTLCNSGTVQFTDTVLVSLSAVTSRDWNFGDGGTSTAHNPSHTYAAPGTYNVRLIVTSAQGCKDTTIKTVIVNGLPNVSAASNQNLCQGAATGVTISASGAVTYTWSPATGLSCVNCASPVALPASTTTYVVTGTDANGCTDTGNVTITIVALPNVTASANVTICNGSSTPLTASGATSYVWTPAAGLSCTNCANPTANPTTTTTYIVTGQNAFGCSDTGMITVTVNPRPTVSAGSNVTICNGSSTVLLATGANTYSWSPATGLSCANCASPTATPTTTTTYTVTGTDLNGCSNTATVTVTVNPKPTVSAGSNAAICAGNSTILTASGANTYVWSPATGLSCTNCASPVATPATTTTYTVTGTDGNGCSNIATVTVTVNNRPNVTISGNNVICFGFSTTLTANGASAYTWTPSAGLSCTNCANPIATPANTTAYVVTGTDANGCTDTGMITVTVNPKPTVNAGSNRAICNGSSTVLSATGAGSYIWSPATGLSCTNCANATATPSATTTYKVIGTDVNGCKDTQQVIVTVNSLPVVGAGSAKSICMGSSATLVATGASTYVWSPSTGLSCNNCASPIATPTATTTYTVTGTDGNGCVNTATVLVTVNAIPVVTASGGKTICFGDSAQLNVTGANTYTWTPGATLTCTTCTNPISVPTGSTTYMVIGTSNNCNDTDYVTVNVRPVPQVTAGLDQEICVGDTTNLEAKGALSYVWTPSAGLSCTNCAKPLAYPTATTLYYVTGTDADGCKATSFMRVLVHQLPPVNAGNDTSICDGTTLQLKATGATTYTWSANNTLSCTNCPDPVASPVSKTTYTVTGEDNIGCTNSDDITIDIIRKNAITFGKDAEICIGESVILSASGGTMYQWLPVDASGSPNSDKITVTPTTNTRYTIIIKQGDCFVDTGYINVQVHKLPVVDLGPDKNISGGSNLILDAGIDGKAIYQWSPAEYLSCADCPKPTASPRRGIKYTVNVTNEWGCEAQDDINISVSCDKSQVFVPNTFTPNNDGVNDFFFPQGKGLSTVKSFRVYNRWGQLVFGREDMPINEPTIGWDGTYKNAPLKPDVFVYIINAVCESGEPIELKGDISLVR